MRRFGLTVALFLLFLFGGLAFAPRSTGNFCFHDGLRFFIFILREAEEHESQHRVFIFRGREFAVGAEGVGSFPEVGFEEVEGGGGHGGILLILGTKSFN